VSQRLEARIGLRLPGKVEILEGLKAGDTVATAGQARLLRADGLPVRVIDIGRPGAAVAAGGPRAGGRPAAASGSRPSAQP